MHCPECHSLNEASASACSSCGLLLLNLKKVEAAPAPQKRRSDDLAHEKRRSADKNHASCKFCGGDIRSDAIRCVHCSEIVNEEYFRDRSRRLRSRVNYASWVAYLFGLAALVVFRPVGLMSIAGGLLLSIIYYAIPVEPPPPRGEKRRTKLGTLIRQQLRLERVSIPIPHMRNKKLIFVGTPLIAAVVGYSANLILLQQPVNNIIKENAALQGMSVSAHYEYWVVPGVVVYDLKKLSGQQTPMDVHKAFLEFAKTMKEKRYSRVELSYKGTTKFSIDGASFSQLGEAYAKRNFDFALSKFPSLFHARDGAKMPAPGMSDGDALTQFHKQ
ncbi:MAG: hypothetical protein ABI837_13745, partial [Acidobacteriota bacterium]